MTISSRPAVLDDGGGIAHGSASFPCAWRDVAVVERLLGGAR